MLVNADAAPAALRAWSTSFLVTTRKTSSTPSPDSAEISWQQSQPMSCPQKPELRFELGLRAPSNAPEAARLAMKLRYDASFGGLECAPEMAVAGGVLLKSG